MSLKLFVFEKPLSEPSHSYFCNKAECYFRATGLEYSVEHTLPFSAPKGKLPFVEFPDGEKLPDTFFIIRRLVSTGQCKDLDASLTPVQRADSLAWQGWIDDRIYPATVWTRFGNDQNWNEMYNETFGTIPFGLRQAIAWYMRRGAKASLWGHGIARHSDEEVQEILQGFLDAVQAKLDIVGEEGWLMGGDSPSMVDVCVYAWCANCLNTAANPFISEGVLKNHKLKGWLEKKTMTWFPEYENLLRRLRG
ncbi:hypothetical protein CALVIDRAFT_542966 [Calocera viscosa TUFC12733]|uniref:Thioredoxin-like fold domain-containing protein n=1 Tax=Calocera viscosa (strain TUFC12733) TaxID=1330018 RepID=A0A167G3B8_CALVF|nr:hypothetical protein CALVIDRAFT_542966 [Calocera viscosa TUFC12733]